jgi:hypothetical protein
LKQILQQDAPKTGTIIVQKCPAHTFEQFEAR